MESATPTSIKMDKVPATVKPMLQAKKPRIRLHKLEEGEVFGASGFFFESFIFKSMQGHASKGEPSRS
jgi:hypothetical protein